MTSAKVLEARVRDLQAGAGALAAPIVREARGSTSPACERALLRLFGVAGLDRAGRPLALQVVERFAEDPERLARGIALPFAVAALEYDLGPQQLALEVASGHVDLALEAELLSEPDKRGAAEDLVGRWLSASWERFDANRTARSELLDVLGDPGMPWIGAELEPAAAGDAATAVRQLVGSGADLVRIPVPRDRELRRGLGEDLDRAEDLGEAPLAPSGSQRGLGLVRSTIDEAAAEAGRYVRLATRALGLAAPDQAVVAGLERVDIVYSDPIEAIVEFGIDPARAFTDHAFALELLARAGAALALGPGPVVVAPEMTRREPLRAPTRAGRSLAMQALNVAVSRRCLTAAQDILVSALPADLLLAPAGLRHGLAEVELRRLLLPDHGLVFEEPVGAEAMPRWPPALTAWCCAGSTPALVMRRTSLGAATVPADELRAAVEAAGSLATSRTIGELRGEVLEYALASLEVALQTLDDLAARGWESILEDGGRRRGLGGAGVVRRRAYLDPFDHQLRSAAEPAARARA